MFKFIIIPLIIVVFLFSIISKILRVFRPKSEGNNSQQRRSAYNDEHSAGYNQQPKKFSEEEGEYIDYEEVEDE
jgi:hypothetical protein